jgi:integrase/recombinase XerD
MIKPISPLRQRMIDDMTMRNLSPSTQETYIRAVAQFSTFHRRSPDKLGVEHLRDYHLHLVSRGLTANSIWVKTGALRFFYRTTLRRPDIAEQIPMPRRLDNLPTVLAREEVERLLKAVPDLKLRQWPQPVAENHPRYKVHRRNRDRQIASSNRCRLIPSVTKIRR